MISALKKNKTIIRLLLIINLLLIVSIFIFFDFYKTRKINQFNKLNDIKNKEIQNIEKIFSTYYHSYKKFSFYIDKPKSDVIKSQNYSYNITKIKTNLYFSKSSGQSTAYLDLYKNNLILTTASGLFFLIKEQDFNKKNISPIKIETNIDFFFNNENFYLKSSYGIKDILFDNNNIYITYNNEVKKNCFNTGILKATFNDKYLEFEKFFNQSECKSKQSSKYNTFSVHQAGGRLIKYNDNFLLSHGSYSEFDEVQDDKSIFGKILLIDNLGKLNKIFSKGHRNPQGLTLFQENIIIETEHGPNGGDELNIIEENKNYGWPISSYGKHYEGQKHMQKYYPLPKSHQNFSEPIKYFDESIAISQIIGVPKKFNNSTNDSLFLSSMKINKNFGESINLFELKFKDKKLFINDIIPIGERIRDLIYHEKRNEIIMFLDTSASIAFLKKVKIE